MIIESINLADSVTGDEKPSYFWPMVLGTIVTLAATTLPILFVVVGSDGPTGTLLSPLPGGVVAEAQSAPTPTNLNFNQTINLAQNYLNKAFDLARNQNQSEEDKKAIVVSLAESLKQATNSINLAPNQPEGYFLRAQVLTAISKINPKAAGLAKQDLELAAKLASDKNIVLPPPVNPVDLLPDEQAGTPQNLIIASPAEAETKENQSNVSANANQKRFILPAGQTEMTIKDTLVKADSFIYLIPENNNNLLVTLASKEIGSFSVTVDAPAKNDIPVDYYIINE